MHSDRAGGHIPVREVVIIPVSPLNAPGLLTSRGWDTLRAAGSVFNSCAHPAWGAHLREAGIEAWHECSEVEGDRAHLTCVGVREALAQWVRAFAQSEGSLVWLADAEHPYLSSPPVLIDEVAAKVAGDVRVQPDFVFASPVAPGSAVVESVRVVHELRSPGGDRWAAQQTHRSLARYLLEETYEVLEELEREDPEPRMLVAELGDLLFQLLFHARIGSEAASPWTMDSIARAFNEKMYRRNPHVFGPVRSDLDVEQTVQQWNRVKARERERSSLSDGLPRALPALQRAFKVVQRARSLGVIDDVLRVVEELDDPLARALMRVVVEAESHDEDPESLLRVALRKVEHDLQES